MTHDHTRYRVARPPKRYAVLLNARAKGWSGQIHQDVHRYVPTRDLFLTDDFHQAKRTVERLLMSDEYDAIFAGGGDGTIVYLLNTLEQAIRRGAIARERAPLIGVLRLGTGNAIATYLGANDIIDDLRALRAGRPLMVHDVNMIESPDSGMFPFAGVGWDADILNDYELLKDTVRDTALEAPATGLGGYGASIVSRTIPRALTQIPAIIRLTNLGAIAKRVTYEGELLQEFAPGEVMYEGPMRICSAASIPYWGFQVRMFPLADASPDLFQLRCYYGPMREVLAHLRRFWRGRVPEHYIHDLLVQHARLEVLGEAVPYQVSGDASGLEREITWQLSPHPVRLAVPMH